MARIYICTLCDERTERPACVGIKIGDRIIYKDVFRKGAGRTIACIREVIAGIRQVYTQASALGHTIVTTDFRTQIRMFELALYKTEYDVYDVHLPPAYTTGDSIHDQQLLNVQIQQLQEAELHAYQKILANAAVVYQSLEDVGIVWNFDVVHPIWSQNTYSGRSKTVRHNVQGMTQADYVRAVGMGPKDVFLHFDWVCADIRIAAILSDDARLTAAFDDSDPYVSLGHVLNDGTPAAQQLTREECKQYLLQSINSMSEDSVAWAAYPDLQLWIARCKHDIQSGTVTTILGRKFRKAHSRNDLAMLNGIMQGSVAHAMHRVIRKIWESWGNALVAEIHDSLVMQAPPNEKLIRSIIKDVVGIMLHPFDGILPDNPAFPVKVSLGKAWKQWQILEIHRVNGITRYSA